MAADLFRTQTIASTSSVGAEDTEPSFYHPLSPPPRGEVKRYERRPLPPVPAERHSLLSTFSKEVNEALATPEGSIFDYRQPEFSSTEWEKGDAEIAVILDKQTLSKLRERPKLVTASVPTTPPDQVISPQPRSSVRKAQQVSGRAHIPILREKCATLHNPDQKIHSVMGGPGIVDPKLIRHHEHIRAARREQRYDADEASSISPLSIGSSTYSRVPETALSEADMVEADANARGYSSDPGSDRPSPRLLKRSSTVSSVEPVPPQIPRSPKSQQSPGMKTPKPALFDEASPWFGDHPNPRAKYSPDLYHQAQVQLAWDDRRAAQHSPGRDLNSPGPSYSHVPVHYARVDDTLAPGNGVFSRALAAEGDMARPVSSSSFGRPLPQYSPSPSSSDRGALRTRFESDLDNNRLDTDTIGAPETRSSIPVTNSPEIRRRHRASLINLSPAKAKAFFRRSGSGGTSSPANTPAPTLTAATAAAASHPCPIPPHPQHSRTVPTTQTKIKARSKASSPRFPFYTSQRSTSAPASYSSLQTPSSPSAGPPASPSSTTAARAAAKAAGLVGLSSTLAAKTSDLMGFLSRSAGAAGAGGDERRRQRLKSSIRVLPGGGQVFPPPPIRAPPRQSPVVAAGGGAGTHVGIASSDGGPSPGELAGDGKLRMGKGGPVPGGQQGGSRSGGGNTGSARGSPALESASGSNTPGSGINLRRGASPGPRLGVRNESPRGSPRAKGKGNCGPSPRRDREGRKGGQTGLGLGIGGAEAGEARPV